MTHRRRLAITAIVTLIAGLLTLIVGTFVFWSNFMVSSAGLSAGAWISTAGLLVIAVGLFLAPPQDVVAVFRSLRRS